MEIEARSNPEVGNIWSGWIISQLAESWPATIDIDPNKVIIETGVCPNSNVNHVDLFTSLLLWLKKEEFIYLDGIDLIGQAFGLIITAKSHALLNRQPENLGGKTIRDAMADAAKDIGREATKSTVVELFGQFVGGVIKSATS